MSASEAGYRFDGRTTAVENGEAWTVVYCIDLDANWLTRRVNAWSQSAIGKRTLQLEADGKGRWIVNGTHSPKLDGCLDVDFESSALTNAFPVRRFQAAVGDECSAPAAYVRALELRVERLEQRYRRLPDEDSQLRFDYHAPACDFSCVLTYDASGLPLVYPGIAVAVPTTATASAEDKE